MSCGDNDNWQFPTINHVIYVIFSLRTHRTVADEYQTHTEVENIALLRYFKKSYRRLFVCSVIKLHLTWKNNYFLYEAVRKSFHYEGQKIRRNPEMKHYVLTLILDVSIYILAISSWLSIFVLYLYEDVEWLEFHLRSNFY
jgi:hypothetical protein